MSLLTRSPSRTNRSRAADERGEPIITAPAPLTPDAILDAVRPGGRPSPSAEREEPSKPDVETVREAIKGGSTRRTVVRTGVWSVPVVAAAVAAPAFAASAICATCTGTRPPQCLISGTGGGTGTCTCGPNLICVGTGPLGLANVCLGTGIATSTCGTTSCSGLCLTTGTGGLVTSIVGAINTLRAALDAPLVGCNAVSNTGIPSNVCVTPLATAGVGTLGALCVNTTGGGVIGGATAIAVNALLSTLGGLGLGPASSCGSGLTCTGGAGVNVSGAACLIGGLQVQVGFCTCPGATLP